MSHDDKGLIYIFIYLINLIMIQGRRVAYSLPADARQYGVQFRWWQPDHDGTGADQWALDNVEIVL